MSFTTTKKVLIFVVGTLVTYHLCKKVASLSAKPLPAPSPGPGPGPVPTPQPGSQAPMLLVGPSIPIVTGTRYFATVNVGFPASLGASPEKIQSLARDRGFTNVFVSESLPAGWPGKMSGDYYVQGDYTAQASAPNMEREPGPGIEVVEIFITTVPR